LETIDFKRNSKKSRERTQFCPDARLKAVATPIPAFSSQGSDGLSSAPVAWRTYPSTGTAL
jgi:hypothetical protein